MKIIKRDGTEAEFDRGKIHRAIEKAGELDQKAVAYATTRVVEGISERTLTVEAVQDIVEEILMFDWPDVARKYVLYRAEYAEKRRLLALRPESGLPEYIHVSKYARWNG